MRLHQLTIEGIGPYAERQTLDFDALTEHGLFLLTGPTGAGKSTVLDAIVFALFGTVAGARGGSDKRERHRARAGIVSDLRALDTTPLVELEFTLGERRFRVRRTPEHERPALRGGGTTTAKPSASLSELTDTGWEPRSSDFAEIGGELQALLGMNADQFTQVVLLPQGQFAGFLRAPVKERRAILERLFRVDRYQAAEAWLEDAARSAREAETEARAELRALIAELAGALGPRAGDRPDAELDAAASWIEQQRFDAEGLVEVTTIDADAAARAADADDAARRRAQATRALLTSLAARRDERSALEQRCQRAASWLETTRWQAIADDPERWEAAVGEAQARAAELAAAVEERARATQLSERIAAARREAARAERAAQDASASLPALRERVERTRKAATAAEQAGRAVEALRAEQERLDEQLQALTRSAELAARRTQIEQQLLAAAEATRAADQELAALATADELEARAAAHGNAERAASGAHAAAQAQLDEAERELVALRLRAERVAALQREREPRATASRAAIDAAQRARDAHQTAREVRLDAMAAELAAGLHDADPCPVCGSPDHPAPAPPHPGGDLRAAEQATLDVLERCEQERRSAEHALATLEAELDALQSAALPAQLAAAEQRLAGARHDIAAAAERVSACARDGAALAEARATRRAAEAQADRARQAMIAVRDELAALDQQRAAVDARRPTDPERAKHERDELAAELARLQQALGEGPERREALEAAERSLEAAREQATTQREAAAGHLRTADALATEHAELESRLAPLAEGHGDLAAAADAARQDAAGLTEAARVHDQAVRAGETVRDLITELATQLNRPAAELERSDSAQLTAEADRTLAETEQAWAASSARQREALQAATDAQRCLDAAVGAAERLSTLRATLGPAAAQAERLQRLDATVRGQGDNTRRISLTTYVLAARLEHVAAAATAHLLRMSSGRYSLVHHDERYGNGPAGLGLRVHDAWSGEERDTATLSGGESFQASLALALGLAEVVQHEAGGRRLETLLIDEGFGSLDPAALEEVLGELDDLRASGRVIGLVSHVPALAERIPSQLQITAGRRGSTATVLRGGIAV